MTDDPLNRLPVDPAWAKRIDELTRAAAQELGCMVLLVAIQEPGKGKVAVALEGVPRDGPLAEIAKDVPGMLFGIAHGAQLQQEHMKKQGGPH